MRTYSYSYFPSIFRIGSSLKEMLSGPFPSTCHVYRFHVCRHIPNIILSSFILPILYMLIVLARSWREILEKPPLAAYEQVLTTTPALGFHALSRLSHSSKPLELAYVTFRIISKPKDCGDNGIEKLVV